MSNEPGVTAAGAGGKGERERLAKTILSRWFFYTITGTSPEALWWRVPVVAAILNAMVFAVCWMEGTLRLPGEGMGLLEDAGRLTHVLFVWIFAFAMPRSIDSFVRFFSCLEKPSLAGTVFQAASPELQASLRREYRRALGLIGGPLSGGRRWSPTVAVQVIAVVVVVAANSVPVLLWPAPVESHVLSPQLHPWSHVASVVWSVYGWALLCSAGFWVGGVLMWKTVAILKAAVAAGALTVIPASPDRAGGLRELGAISYSFFWGAFSLTPFLIGAFFMPDIGLRLELWLPVYLAVLIACIAYPMRPALRLMRERKRQALEQAVHDFNRVYLEWESAQAAGAPAASERLAELEEIQNQYERADTMPVWPFDLQSVTKIGSLFLIPFAAFAIDMVTNTDSVLFLLMDYHEVKRTYDLQLVVSPPGFARVEVDGETVEGTVAPAASPGQPAVVTVPAVAFGFHHVAVAWPDGTAAAQVTKVPPEGGALVVMRPGS